ncbi:chloride conductance regulatory protein ICln isoform X1 [Cynara cardunculus var. scolymus]|uniref:chloride conductance regulatory protein ICln isoform X1 n=1 Tax=Cynara cardunculus var. scolymus TaxID=59895 RepID=UPI000D62BF23|nr:chloride conductance regulatory protein ICln isoform X1 [Cynara cardunculus var. scolymus]
MVAGLRVFTERSNDGAAGAPILDTDNGEELMHVQPSVSIVLGNRPPESPGTLYISTKQVVWLSDTERTKGYAVDFLSVSLHAVSRDPEAFSSPCIYTQIDTGDEDDESESSDSESNGTLDLSKITEMRLVPSDPNQLDTLFEVFCECAELNPEPVVEALFSEDEQEHNWIFSADQLGPAMGIDGVDLEWDSSPTGFSTIGHPNGDHDLARNVLELQINDQRFEDAEEMERDNSNGRH